MVVPIYQPKFLRRKFFFSKKILQPVIPNYNETQKKLEQRSWLFLLKIRASVENPGESIDRLSLKIVTLPWKQWERGLAEHNSWNMEENEDNIDKKVGIV